MIDRVKMELQNEFWKYKRADLLMFLTGKKMLITYIVKKKMKLCLRTNSAICYGILMTVLMMMIFVKQYSCKYSFEERKILYQNIIFLFAIFVVAIL